MLLVYSPNSLFARKCRVLALEKKLNIETAVHMPFDANSKVPDFNPLGKVPALQLDDGRTLFDSRVIAEYFDGIQPNPRFIPEDFAQRIAVRRWEALADGVGDALALVVYENRRADAAKRSADWIARQSGKVEAGLKEMSRELGERSYCVGDNLTLADVAVGCVLLFMNLAGKFPMPDFQVRSRYANLAALCDRLSERPSFQATVPPG